MTPTPRTRWRKLSLGCLMPIGLVILFEYAIFWIVWPQGSAAQWDLKTCLAPEFRNNQPIEPDFRGVDLGSDGTVMILSNGTLAADTTSDCAASRLLRIEGRALNYSPDGTLIATSPVSSSGKGPIRIYQSSDARLLQELQDVMDQQVLWTVWMPNSRLLAVRYFESERYVFWDVATATQVLPPFPLPSRMLGMVCSPDGQFVYVSTADTLVKVRLADGQEVYQSPLPWSELRLSPDGLTLLAYDVATLRAVRASDGVVLWHLGQGGSDLWHVLAFEEIGAVAISPNSQYVVAGEITSMGILGGVSNADIALIQMQDGTIVRRYQADISGVGFIAFTSDSQSFLSGSRIGMARWNVTSVPTWAIWVPVGGLVLLIPYLIWFWRSNRRTG